eukprot:703529-Prorocentrum_lima.AAC.1
MTSSLVGSEMCIRDRTKRRCTGSEDAGVSHQQSAAQGHAERGVGHRLNCLLYTSDAADDM